jgi:hypothetical protein
MKNSDIKMVKVTENIANDLKIILVSIKVFASIFVEKIT